MTKKISVANVENMKEINIKNASKFEIDFEKIDALWESDLKNAEEHLYGDVSTTIKDLKKKLKEIVIDDEDDKATMKAKVDKKNEIKRAIEKAEKQESKKNEGEQKKVSDYASVNGELVKYIRDRVFSLNVEGYYIIEKGKLEHKNEKQFSKLIKKLNSKHSKIARNAIDDCKGLFKCEVSAKDCMVDKKGRIINLAKRFNYMYDEKAKLSKKKGEFILDFIREVITSDREKENECILDILTCCCHRVQSQVILFLCALGGVGKTTFTNILRELYGIAFANANEDVMSGETQFNHILIGSVVACLEETSGKGSDNYKKLMRGLKEMATSKTLTARRMFQESYDVLNILNLIILSNHPDLEIGDRKIFTPTISNKKMGDTEYFGKLNSYIEDKEAMQYVFNYLHNRKVPKMIVPPMTETKASYKEANMHSTVRFIIEEYMVKNQHEKLTIKTNEFFKLYQDWAKTKKGLYTCNNAFNFHDMVGRHIKKALNESGSEIVCQGVKKYDLSYESLKNYLINHIGVISEERLLSMQEEHKVELEQIPADEQNDNRDEYEQEIDFWKGVAKLNEQKLSEMEELVKQLKKQIDTIKIERTENKKVKQPKSEARLVESMTSKAKRDSYMIDIDNDEFSDVEE